MKTGRREVGVRSKTGNNSSTASVRVRSDTGRYGCDTIVVVFVLSRRDFTSSHLPFVPGAISVKTF